MSKFCKRLFVVVLMAGLVLLLFACSPNTGRGNRTLYPEIIHTKEDIWETPTEGVYALRGEVLLLAKSGVRLEDMERLIRDNAGSLVGYVESLGFYHFTTDVDSYATLENLCNSLSANGSVEDAMANYLIYDSANSYAYIPNPLWQQNYDPSWTELQRYVTWTPDEDYTKSEAGRDSDAEVNWAQKLIRLYEAHDLLSQVSTTTVKIGVRDSWLDYDHPDLQIPKANVKQASKPDSNTGERDHGTHVTGIIAATSGNGIGIHGVMTDRNVFFAGSDILFLSTDLELMKERYSAQGIGSVASSLYGFKWLADKGCRVINFSMSIAATDRAKLFAKTYMEKFFVEHPNILIVTSAGNINKGALHPINVKDAYGLTAISDKFRGNLLTVGAVDAQSKLSHFSNYGELVDIVAPGGTTNIAQLKQGYAERIVSTFADGNYGTMEGTSQAAPFVTGVAGLIWEINPDLSVSQVREILLDSAREKKVVAASNDVSYSYPLLNAYRAVEMAIATLPEDPPTETQTQPPTESPLVQSTEYFKKSPWEQMGFKGSNSIYNVAALLGVNQVAVDKAKRELPDDPMYCYSFMDGSKKVAEIMLSIPDGAGEVLLLSNFSGLTLPQGIRIGMPIVEVLSKYRCDENALRFAKGEINWNTLDNMQPDNYDGYSFYSDKYDNGELRYHGCITKRFLEYDNPHAIDYYVSYSDSSSRNQYGGTDYYTLDLLIKGGNVFGINLSFEAPGFFDSAGTTVSESDLQDLLRAKTSAAIITFEYADYDGDGTCEAFAATGKITPEFDDMISYTDCTLWFIDASGATVILSDTYSGIDGEGAEYTFSKGNQLFFRWVQHAFGSGYGEHVFGVRDGKPYRQ